MKAKKMPVKRGPKPEVLKIDGGWHGAIKKTFAKKKPAAGWPKDNKNGPTDSRP